MIDLLRQLWFWIKSVFAAAKKRLGLSSGQVAASLEVAEPTWDRFEQACITVGLDPEQFRKGEQNVGDAERPSGDDRRALYRLVCANPGAIPFGDLSPHEQDAVLSYVLNLFFIEALRRFSEEQSALVSMLSDAAQAPSTPTGPKKPSAAALRDSLRKNGRT